MIYINNIQYTLIKIPISEIIPFNNDKNNYNIKLKDGQTEVGLEYIIAQGNSLMFDQIIKLRKTDKENTRIKELILIVAKKNKKTEEKLRDILKYGFSYNGVHYSRFGKSASQGKAGITAFVSDDIFEELYMITQMDIKIDECVISKYESQRCLPFSGCTIIDNYIPNIVIIDEYEKTLHNQFIKYVVEKEKEFKDDNGKIKKYKSREIEEGYRDINISPFDGCGCHEEEFKDKVGEELDLGYKPVGNQVRLPFIKGYSIYIPFKKILKEWGYTTITDVYGKVHNIDDVDCIWNTSMFKGHKIFKKKYGNEAWDKYIETLKKYNFSLGISKYSHHISHLNKYTRFNFQYIQCLNLWNDKYINAYNERNMSNYDILDSKNDGKVIKLAKYTTNLYEKIINGDKFYTYKFMGINETKGYKPESKYIEACLVNDVMLKDPAVKQFIYRKLKKSIDEAKIGKIYCSGFYHTGVGDMIGYLQYAMGLEPVGCLKAHELYSGNFNDTECCSFRSPLVDASEVNKINLVHNSTTDKWFKNIFKDQDVVMFNMYDISAPQQGGADFDGDIFLICDDDIVVDSKIDKPIILDIEDKVTAKEKKYNKENLIEYEVMTRDSRIGEITNVATSIENKYTDKKDIKKLFSDYSSLLRIFQGKEIDFLKTGFRWNINKGLRKYSKQLPYFLLYKYPDKMKTYKKICEKNKNIDNDDEKYILNAYHSPSPMNELCDYICTWEKKHILWNNKIEDLIDTRCLIVNNDLILNDKKVNRICRRFINDYAKDLKYMLRKSDEDENYNFDIKGFNNLYKEKLINETNIQNEELLANYIINVSYKSLSISKSMAWSVYGDYIIKNLKNNTNPKRNVSIIEVPYKDNTTYEYLGKYYKFEVGDTIVRN